MQSMMAAAIVVLAAGSASAQALKAEIPFPFAAGSSMMMAGTYHVQVDRSGHERFVIIQNAATNKAAIVTITTTDVPMAWKASGNPVLQFQCAGGHCALRQLWSGGDGGAYNFRTPKSVHGDMQVAEIRMSIVKAD